MSNKLSTTELATERARCNSIMAIGRKYGSAPHRIDAAILEGMTPEQFERLAKVKPGEGFFTRTATVR